MPGDEVSKHQDGTVGQTDRNREFVQAMVYDVKKLKLPAEHYRDIFGGSASEQSMSSMASRLWRAPAMQEYADELRAEMRERFMVTVESLLEELEEARQVGRETKSAGPMVAATMGKAKLAGLDKQIIEHRGDIPVGAVTIEVISARPENNGN
jgi:phage terminase small subunit